MGTFYVNLSGKSIQSATGLKVALKLAAAYTGICKSLLYTLLFRFTVQKYIYPSQCSYSIMTEWAFWKCDARIWTFDLSQEGGANQSTLVEKKPTTSRYLRLYNYSRIYYGILWLLPMENYEIRLIFFWTLKMGKLVGYICSYEERRR